MVVIETRDVADGKTKMRPSHENRDYMDGGVGSETGDRKDGVRVVPWTAPRLEADLAGPNSDDIRQGCEDNSAYHELIANMEGPTTSKLRHPFHVE